MEENENIEIEKENDALKNENINKNKKIHQLNDENWEMLNKIFQKSKSDNSQFIPILLKNTEPLILKVFSEKLDIKEGTSLEDLILQKLNFISQIRSIVNTSPEILYIITNFLLKKHTSIFIYIIDLYISYITQKDIKLINEKIINYIKTEFSFLINSGLLTKKDVDYIYQKIAFFQLEKKLSMKIFKDIMPLIEIIYGTYIDDNNKPNIIAKKYFYLYEKDNSMIETNISENKFIQIKNGFSIILWFYLKDINEENGYKSSLVYLKNEKGDKINIILNDKYDIDITYNNDYNFTERDNKKFDIKKNIWTQLIICVNKNEINVYLYQSNNRNDIEGAAYKKTYENNLIKNYSFYDCKITEITFFKNYLGIVGTIIFLNESENGQNQFKKSINYLSEIKNKNVNDILTDKSFAKSLCFIFSPNIYFNNQIIIDPKNNCIGRLASIDNNKFNLNSIFSFHNYINNIFYIGGCNNFLPLFEIFYKFTLNAKNRYENINDLITIFNKLFKLLETVFAKDKNCKIPLQKDIHFFNTLQIFMEKIDENFYYNNIELLNIILNIGKKYNELNLSKIKENNSFFINIIFNPDIIIKFNLELQKIFFEEIKSFQMLMPFNKINNFLTLLSQKYKKDEIEKNKYSETLFNYIKMVFDNNNVNDSDRESLFLLCRQKDDISKNNSALSVNIIINIIKIFIVYLDIKINSFIFNEEKINQRKQTVDYLLNSENNFIENLLKYLSETNIHIKKVIINFLRVLTQIYGDILEDYFLKLNKKKKNERIKKEEFYFFIKENIAPNYYNELIQENNSSIKHIDRKDSIFYLEEENKSNIIINDNSKKIEVKNKLLIRKRSKSFDNNKKIKSSEIMKNISNNIFSIEPQKKRKNSYTIYSYFLNDKVKDNALLNKEMKQNKKDEYIKIELKVKEELTYEKKLEINSTKLDIALLLYNWLINLLEHKEKNTEGIKDESIDHLIEYIVKFISYTKELDVIFRILFLLESQKETSIQENSDKTNQIIYNSLLLYLSKNSLFLQILVELLIHSYIYQNLYSDNQKIEEDFIILTKKEEDIPKLKFKNFKSIYEKGLELLLDIYFSDSNKNRSEILKTIFLVSLKLLLNFQYSNDQEKKNSLIKFVKQILLEINETYDKKNNSIKKYYLDYFTFFMDYCFMFKNADDHLQNFYKGIKDDRNNCIPDFLVHGIIYKTEFDYQWEMIDIYNKIFNNFKKLFSIKNIFEKLEFIYNDFNPEKGKQDLIFSLDIKLVNLLINDIIYKKKKSEYQHPKNIDALFYSYKDGGYNNNFPIMNIISLFLSLNLYLIYKEINIENNGEKLLQLIKYYQNYIIFLIIISLIINPNDYKEVPEEYNENQILIYKNLFFNIQNILNRLKDQQNKKYYIIVLFNIMIFLSVIFNIKQNEKHKKENNNFLKKMFKSSNIIDITKTAPDLLINFYIKNKDNIFNEKNFLIFIEDNKDKNMKLIADNISFDAINNMNNNKDNNPSFDLYNIEIFQNVLFYREDIIKNKLGLLLEKEKETNVKFNDYKKILLKVKKVKNTFFLDEVKQQQEEIFKINEYRKIKKDLYSYNNSYSNMQVFYDIPSEFNNNKKYLLKYKVCNFLSKDMSPKIIKPIIDINSYIPNFRKFDYSKNNIYHHSIDEVYNVDLQIFPIIKKGFLYPDGKKYLFYKNKYYLEENVCYVKTKNHIKGIIYHLNNIKNVSDNYIYFCIVELPDTKEKIDKYEDYDSLNESCFNSIFRNNMNIKDKNTYIKINFNDINYIFCRKYCYKDNSLEIYTSFHRSYYFKFRNQETRNKFLEHIISILNKDSSLFKKLYKAIYSINEYGKKIILGYYKDKGNNKEYSNIINIKELWKNNQISSFEYLMWINIYGNRSFRDISQYPVFPWIMTDYNTKTFEEVINKSSIRNFKLPMGLLSIDNLGKERQEGYINTYKFMCSELKEEDLKDFQINEEEDKIEEEQNDNKDDKISDIALPKIPKYNYNIEKLYKNVLIDYEKIPYLFGSHYSNAMYISHYMGRLFPFSLTMIEIQGAGFDCSERLFLCLQKTFSSAASEKCDVRELIPEFFSMPELFMNIN